MADGFADLGDFQRVSEAGAVEVVFTAPEDLGLVLQTAKGRRVENPVAIDLKRRSEINRIARSRKPLGIEVSIKSIFHRRRR